MWSRYGNGTLVFSTTFSAADAKGQHYPMEWEPKNTGVPGVERTQIYADWCNKC